MLQLAIASLIRPEPSIQQVLRMQVPDAILFRVAVIVACISGIIEPVIVALINDPELSAKSSSPIMSAGIQLAVIMVTAFAIDRIGNMFGGTGEFNGALKVSVWYGIVSIVPSAVVLLLTGLGGPAGTLAFVAVPFWLVFVLATFVRVLHGFRSQFLTLLGVLGSSFLILVFSLILLNMLGIVNLG